tara:strand:- start:198 stop:395 length:198 start_codon:yes stop_codon:yes gene_type:complete
MIKLLIILILVVQIGCTSIGTTMVGSFLGHLSADMVYDKMKEEEQKEDKLNAESSPQETKETGKE